MEPDHYDESAYRRDVYYATLDRILEGWPEVCGDAHSLMWVRDRIIAAEQTATEVKT